MKQPKRGRLWLNDGSCVRLRPERPNHVWSYDFVQDRTQDGRAFRMLVVLDEFTRRCLAIIVARRLRSDDVLHCLADLFVTHGPPEHIRSDNGPVFIAINVREWLGRLGVKTIYIEPGSPWENGYCESLNSKLRDELLNGEIFTTMREAASADRELETPLQCYPPALVPWLPATGSRSDLAASIWSALRSAAASPDAGRPRPGSNLELGIVMRGRPGGAGSGAECPYSPHPTGSARAPHGRSDASAIVSPQGWRGRLIWRLCDGGFDLSKASSRRRSLSDSPGT